MKIFKILLLCIVKTHEWKKSKPKMHENFDIQYKF